MAQPVANNQSSNVQQDSTFWSGINRNTVQGLYGAGSNLYTGLNSFGKNPLVGGLTVASAYGNLQQAFPGTFQNPQQNPTMQNANYYGGAASNYAGLGLQGINAYGNLQQGNIAAGLSGLSSIYDQTRNQTGLPAAPGYVNGILGGANIIEGLSKGNYGQSILGGAQLYNQGVTSGLINTGPVPQGLVGGLTGGINLVQGLQNKNYAQAGLGASSLVKVAADNYAPIVGLIHPTVSTALNAGTTAAVSGSSTAAVSGGTGAAVSGGTGAAVSGGTGAASSGATGAGVAAGSSSTEVAGSSTASVVGSAAGYVAAAYGLYNLGKIALSGGDLKTSDTAMTTASGAAAGAGAGAAIGSVAGGIGALPGAVVGGVFGAAVGFAASASGSHKGTYQNIRDSYREAVLKDGKTGLFDKDYQGELADGTKFDFGKDGVSMKLNTENPFEARGAQLGDILASAQGATGKGRVALATMFAKASASNAKSEADVDKNMTYFANKLGIDKGTAQAQLNRLKIDDKLSDAQYNYFSDILQKSPLAASTDKNVRKLNSDEIVKVRGIQTAQNKYLEDAQDYGKKNKDTIKTGVDFQIPGDPNTYQRDKDGKVIRTKEVVNEPSQDGKGIAPNTDPNAVTDAASDKPVEVQDSTLEYAKKNGIKRGETFQVPGDPNKYQVQPDGRIIGTLIGTAPAGSNPAGVASNGKGIAPNTNPTAVTGAASNGKGIAPNTDASGVINAAAGSSEEDRAMIHGILTDNVRTGPLQFTPEQAAALGRVLGIKNASYKDLGKIKKAK